MSGVAGSYFISTVAGTGTDGYTGDGGAATNAQVAGPSSVATDQAGNIYFVDANNYRVRMVDANRNIHALAGTGTNDNKCGKGPGMSVGFDRPLGVPAGNAALCHASTNSSQNYANR